MPVRPFQLSVYTNVGKTWGSNRFKRNRYFKSFQLLC